FYTLSLFSPSLSLSSLSLLRAIWGRATLRLPRDGPAPQAELISAVGTTGPPSCLRHNLTDLNPGAALSWPENHASEVQPISMRKLQRAVEGRGIHHRANHSFRAKVKSFGVGQNTGETLPNFRQKSKEI
ncbi:hypothetical protein Prudu_706S000100, partial [Prunus dulcis]